MAFIRGVDRILYIKQDGEWLPVGCLTSNAFNESSEMLGTTTRDNVDGWRSSVPTNQEFSISFDGVLTDDYASDTVITYYALQLLKRARTLIEWRIESVESDYEDGFGYISDLANVNSVDEYVTFSGTITGFGFTEAVEGGFLLLEDSNFVLLETGGKIILE
jgi:TP901-1 family phage major tail protein